MPIYEFKCNECHFTFEEIKRLTDDSVPACPRCKGHKTEKQVSTVNSIGKGPKTSCVPQSRFT